MWLRFIERILEKDDEIQSIYALLKLVCVTKKKRVSNKGYVILLEYFYVSKGFILNIGKKYVSQATLKIEFLTTFMHETSYWKGKYAV